MNEIEITKAELFDYSLVDPLTVDFLKQKESVMSGIIEKTYTELGKELQEAQEVLSSHGYGCFEEWYTSLGFKRDNVYRWIARHELIVANCDKRNMIEELPLSLSYEIAKPSANTDLKQQVLAGEITTHKQYKELEKRANAAEQRTKQLESERIHLENQTITLQQELNKEKTKPPQVVTETVNIVPDDYNDLKRQAIVAQQLNGENVVLHRKNQELAQKLHENHTAEREISKLRERCVEIMRTLAANHTTMMMELPNMQGHPEAAKLIDDYGERMGKFVDAVFKDLKGLSEVKRTKGVIIDVE